MSERRWTDPSQPQTLQGAVILSYTIAAFALLTAIIRGASLPLLLIPLAVAAYFVANERRWAYYLACVISVVYLVAQFSAWAFWSRSIFGLLPVLFAGALLALLLHRQSRSYQRIYFH